MIWGLKQIFESYLLFGAVFQGDPVLSVGADVYFVGLDKVYLVSLLGNGTLCPDGRDEAQKAEVHLQRGWRCNYKFGFLRHG